MLSRSSANAHFQEKALFVIRKVSWQVEFYFYYQQIYTCPGSIGEKGRRGTVAITRPTLHCEISGCINFLCYDVLPTDFVA